MKEKNKKVDKLLQEIKISQEALTYVNSYYSVFKNKKLKHLGKNTETAIILGKILTNYYECLETMFLKISSFFENKLPAGQWHKRLLNNMTIQIENMREQVISEKTYDLLEEFLKFRHFYRYKVDFDYNWKKLEDLEKKYDQVQPLLKQDIEKFIEFLKKL